MIEVLNECSVTTERENKLVDVLRSLHSLDVRIVTTLKEIIKDKNESLSLRIAALDRYLLINPSSNEDLDLLLLDESQLLRKVVPFLLTK